MARVKLRLDHTPKFVNSKLLLQTDLSDKENLRKMFVDFLNIHVSDLTLDLSMSTVTGLADLAEDEIIPIPISMEVCISQVHKLFIDIFSCLL